MKMKDRNKLKNRKPVDINKFKCSFSEKIIRQIKPLGNIVNKRKGIYQQNKKNKTGDLTIDIKDFKI